MDQEEQSAAFSESGTRPRSPFPGHFQQFNLEVAAHVEVQARGTAITITPTKRIPKGQAWFYTAEWQAREREADEAIARGAVSRPFGSARELIRRLEKTSRWKRAL